MPEGCPLLSVITGENSIVRWAPSPTLISEASFLISSSFSFAPWVLGRKLSPHSLCKIVTGLLCPHTGTSQRGFFCSVCASAPLPGPLGMEVVKIYTFLLAWGEHPDLDSRFFRGTISSSNKQLLRIYSVWSSIPDAGDTTEHNILQKILLLWNDILVGGNRQ